MESRVIHAIGLYVAILLLTLTFKPSFLCNDDGSIKKFGLNHDETLFTAPVIAMSAALVTYYVLVFQK
jgi:hypothetical protein